MSRSLAEVGTAPFSADVLRLDAAAEVERICGAIREQIFHTLKRRGAVAGLSGGIDSSVVAGLLVRALGPDRVLGLLMPEADSSADSLRLGQMVAAQLGIASLVDDVTPVLEATGCYRRRDEAIHSVIPHYGPGYKNKIVLPRDLVQRGYSVFSVVVESPQGVQTTARLTAGAYRALVAAMNFKQRVRKMIEYYHADRLHYTVVGTPNRLEYEQGFFVKNGDGAADLKPIAHLYKTQVYQLAEFLGVPDEIRQRQPTTDTYSLAQSQEEFYFSVSYEKLDLCLYGLNHGVPTADVAVAAGLTLEQAERVFQDIVSKRRATKYLHYPAALVDDPFRERCEVTA